MIPCAKCGFDNNEDANFCSRCGSRLAHQDPSDTTVTFAPLGEEVGTLDPLPPTTRTEAPSLLVRAGGGREGERIPLDADLLTIGRNPENDLFLDDVTVSRYHARIVSDATGYVIEDLDSLNGTYVNRRRIERHHLTDGDAVQIGKFKLAYLEPLE